MPIEQQSSGFLGRVPEYDAVDCSLEDISATRRKRIRGARVRSRWRFPVPPAGARFRHRPCHRDLQVPTHLMQPRECIMALRVLHRNLRGDRLLLSIMHVSIPPPMLSFNGTPEPFNKCFGMAFRK